MSALWSSWIVSASPMTVFALKLTALLAGAWMVHFGLAKVNPRWRILMWRMAVVAMVALPVASWWIPNLPVAVVVTEPAAPVNHVFPDVVFPVEEGAATYTVPLLPERGPQPEATAPFFTTQTLARFGGIAWWVGMGLLAARLIAQSVRLRRRIVRYALAPHAIEALFRGVASDLSCTHVQLRMTDEAVSPYVTGLLRPVVVLPRQLAAAIHRAELPGVFAHELAHVKGHDTWWNLIVRAAGIPLWFHPLAWRMAGAHMAACEARCDAVASAYVGNVDAYSAMLARAALEFAGSPRTAATIPMVRSAAIVGRIRRLKSGLRSLPLRRWHATVVSLLCAVGLLMFAAVRVVANAQSTMPLAVTTAAELAAPNPDAGVFAGRVVDESGKPIEGVLVDAWTWHRGDETTTDADGRFRLEGFDEDPIEVRFSKEGYSPLYNPTQPVGITDFSEVMGSKTYFEGRVVGPDGTPSAGTRIRANQGPKQNPGVVISNVWTETTTAEDGAYRLYVQADTFDIQVNDDAGNIARLPGQRIAKDEARLLDIALEPGLVFRANVIDSVTSEPVQGVRLWHWQHEGVEGTSDADGVIEIAGMMPGKFEFDVEKPGYMRWWSEQCVSKWNRPMLDDEERKWQRNFDSLDFNIEPDMTPVTIVVEKGVRVAGKVLDPDGKPVAGATVGPARTGTGNSLTGDTRFSAQTLADGAFETWLPASKKSVYNLMVHDGDYEEWRNWANGVSDPITTQPGDEVTGVVLLLTRPGVVKGVARDASGKPLENVEVRAHAKDKLENRYYDPKTTTDANGNFELKFVRAGEQYIQVEPFWLTAEEAPGGSTKVVEAVAGETIAGVELVSGEEATPAAGAPPDMPSEFNAKLKVGDIAPNFEATLLDGSAVKLSDLRGKPLLLDFWATWCGPCVEELPNVIEVYKKYLGQGFEILGISLDNEREALEAFLKEHPDVTWPQVFDGKGWHGAVGQQYGVDAIPFTLLVNKTGKIVGKSLRGAQLEQAIGELIAKGEVAMSDSSFEHPKKPEPPAFEAGWQERFDAVYRLDEDEVLKRIPPPWIPERMAYYWNTNRSQAELIPDGPDFITFDWDGQTATTQVTSFGDVGTIDHVMNWVLDLSDPEFVIEESLKSAELRGDWIVRKGTSQKDLIFAMEPILQEALGRPVNFHRRPVQRDVIVARGTFKFQALPNYATENSVQLMSIDDPDDDGGAGGSGSATVDDMLQRLSDLALIEFIDETSGPADAPFSYETHRSASVEGDDAELGMLLDNVAKQTGLTFTKERRTVDIWLVRERDDAEDERAASREGTQRHTPG